VGDFDKVESAARNIEATIYRSHGYIEPQGHTDRLTCLRHAFFKGFSDQACYPDGDEVRLVRPRTHSLRVTLDKSRTTRVWCVTDTIYLYTFLTGFRSSSGPAEMVTSAVASGLVAVPAQWVEDAASAAGWFDDCKRVLARRRDTEQLTFDVPFQSGPPAGRVPLFLKHKLPLIQRDFAFVKIQKPTLVPNSNHAMPTFHVTAPRAAQAAVTQRITRDMDSLALAVSRVPWSEATVDLAGLRQIEDTLVDEANRLLERSNIDPYRLTVNGTPLNHAWHHMTDLCVRSIKLALPYLKRRAERMLSAHTDTHAHTHTHAHREREREGKIVCALLYVSRSWPAGPPYIYHRPPSAPSMAGRRALRSPGVVRCCVTG